MQAVSDICAMCFEERVSLVASRTCGESKAAIMVGDAIIGVACKASHAAVPKV